MEAPAEEPEEEAPAAPAGESRWHRLRRLAAFVVRRFGEDQCARVASALSYTTLLALVPLLTLVLAIVAAVPGAEDMRHTVEAWVVANVMPAAGDAVSEALRRFLRNAGTLTGPGVLVLVVVALMLFATIEAALNRIFRVAAARPLAVRFLAFWTLLTLGPLLVGLSLSVSGYLYAAGAWLGLDKPTGAAGVLVTFVPGLLAFGFFLVLYMVVPHRPVRFLDALIGAAVATGLFVLLKKGFGLYVSTVPTLKAIYGAFAAVPLFLVWMYLTWSAVLVGAVITASLPEWRAGLAGGETVARAPRRRMGAALLVLGALYEAQRAGETPTRRHLLRHTALPEWDLDSILTALRAAGYTARTDRGRWVLARDLEQAPVEALADALNVTLAAGPPVAGEPPGVTELLDRAAAAQHEALDVPLARLWRGAG